MFHEKSVKMLTVIVGIDLDSTIQRYKFDLFRCR